MSIWKLIIVQLQTAFGTSVMKWYWGHDKKKFFFNIGLGMLILVSLGPIFYLYWRILDGIYAVAHMLDQGSVVITMGLVAGSLIVFLFGIAHVMSTFYFSHDLNFLIALPLKASSIIGGKFSVILISNYITILPFVLPAMVLYGIRTGGGVVYLMGSMLIFLLTPMIPLSLASIAVMLLMRFTNLGQKKDALRLAGMIFFLFIIVVLNVFLTKIPEGMETEYIQRIFTENEGLINYIGRTFPPAILATRALASAGLTRVANFLAYAGISLISTYFTLWVGDRVFYQGYIGGSEISVKKRISEMDLKKQLSRSTSPVMAIAIREIKLLLRTPIYFFNSIAVVILLPVVMIVPLLSSGGLGEIMAILSGITNRMFIVLAYAAFMGSTALFAPAASSSFSREGKTFWISKTIPVHPAEQIKAKVVYSFMITCSAIPLVIVSSIFLVKLSWIEALIAVMMGCVFAIPSITSNLMVDFLRPYLTWDNPQRAIKQNMNVLFGMMLGGGILFAIYLVFNRLIQMNFTSWVVYFGVAITALIAGLIPYIWMIKNATKQFANIEV
jgi:ABC-2 type transport system permease protein